MMNNPGLIKLFYSVTQGSMIGPILFTLFMPPLGNSIRKQSMNFHCYADDMQLYLPMKPEGTHQLVNLQTCFKGIKYTGCLISSQCYN